ncbi:SCO family protein [Rhodoferax sp. U2-2l]|uniref:SCO family protein n=1 Tax=Rhodoferax sp. U2-2l TaxID=2884000 RepID=UPI001D0BD866|nr:SCO family protein [Rhodoferax sp. U2-2l]MCB8745876.1 SCO family protein [Rhodoferax sp. U2-2l]
MNKRQALQKIAGGAFSVWALGQLAACSQDELAFTAINITGASYGKDFALTDHNGQPRTLADFSGKIVMVFFGYTQCPDVCPTSMTEMVAIKQQLGPDGDKLQGLFVTVDPERDRPDVLKAYMAAFDPGFLALYTTPDKLAALAKDFKVYYKKVPGATPTSYTVDHTAGSYVYDTQGKLRLFTRYGTPPEKTAADIRLLLKSAP